MNPASGVKLTLQEVADILNVSRPYVVKLIDDGKLHAVKGTTGDQQLFTRDQVMRVDAEMRATADHALDVIANIGGKEDRKPLKRSRWTKEE